MDGGVRSSLVIIWHYRASILVNERTTCVHACVVFCGVFHKRALRSARAELCFFLVSTTCGHSVGVGRHVLTYPSMT